MIRHATIKSARSFQRSGQANCLSSMQRDGSRLSQATISASNFETQAMPSFARNVQSLRPFGSLPSINIVNNCKTSTAYSPTPSFSSESSSTPSWNNSLHTKRPSQLKTFSTTATASDTSNGNASSSSSNNDKTTSQQEKTNSTDEKKSKKQTNKDDSNIFLDNLGKIFLSSIGIVLVMLLRSTKSNNSRLALREDIESACILDPMEIDDLRAANTEFTMEVWDRIMEEIKNQFPHGVATYPEFLSVVVQVMRNMKGKEFTIQLGHLVDRVVIAELERLGGNDVNDGSDTFVANDAEEKTLRKGLPLPFLLAALSLALHSTVADRIRVLYEAMLLYSSEDDSRTTRNNDNIMGDELGRSAANSTSNQQQLASGDQVAQMVQHLQNTCQLVPDAQIVETNSKVPYQTFRVGTGAELTERARKGFGGKKGSEGVTREGEGPVSLEEFHAILKSRAVGAWGECYVKKAGVMATSDR